MMIALPRSAPPMVSTPRRVVFGELVDVRPRARSRRHRRHRRDDLGVGHVHHPRHRVHDRDRRLATAGDHVDVRYVEVLAQIGGRDHRRADGRRREIDRTDTGFGVLGRRVLVHVRRRRLEHQIGLLVLRQQPVDALVRGFQAEVARALEALALRVDADHPARFEPLRPQQLVQQVGADVAGADDRDACSGRHEYSYSKVNRTDPSPSNSATN